MFLQRKVRLISAAGDTLDAEERLHGTTSKIATDCDPYDRGTGY